jgi:hypothetical protein
MLLIALLLTSSIVLANGGVVFTESDCPPPPSDLTRTDWAVRLNDYASGVIFWCAYLKIEKRQIAGVGERVFTLALAELFLMRIDSEEEARELFLNIIGLEARAKLAQDGRVVDGTAERVTVKFQREKPSANNLEQWTLRFSGTPCTGTT